MLLNKKMTRLTRMTQLTPLIRNKKLKEYSSHSNTKRIEYNNARLKGGAGDEYSPDIINIKLLKCCFGAERG